MTATAVVYLVCCGDCACRWDTENALAVGATHALRYHHHVVGRVTREYRWAPPPAGDDQLSQPTLF